MKRESAIAVAAVAGLGVLWWVGSRGNGGTSGPGARQAAAQVGSREVRHAPARGAAGAPSLDGVATEHVFQQDGPIELTTEMPEGQLVSVTRTLRTGQRIELELAPDVPIADGKQLFVNLSVTDGLGNTVLDCTWRDIELVADAPRTITCDLPAGTSEPLTISGYQAQVASYVDPATANRSI